MELILSGYGRMGKEIEKIALSKGHTIYAKIDSSKDWNRLQLNNNLKVVVDFSLPDVVVKNIMKSFELKLPVVCGTTGWDQDRDRIKKYCTENKNTLFTASNFSIGMNLFFSVNKELAGLMDKFEAYDVELEEIHHIHKLDKPSGTAISIAQDIISKISRKKSWKLAGQNAEDELKIKVQRIGEVPGTHKIVYRSDFDVISLKHKALSRIGFAQGAVLAAEWIQDKKGYFEMDDLLGLR
ncbi:MAG: 4-hydroxy-tetrahydrodipicolinate reductase [Bacteroidales bacterium]|nr:4-hydroxy-tetrahydrodipicolinate reductase [Bacteroidales bacterium]MCF8402797.1 4-hydroxy-tetrahydrodipicolinate reductase [Bacteroidales bacterium]